MPDQLVPTPRDGAPVIVAAAQGITLVWVGPAEGSTGPGDFAGDGSGASRQLINQAHHLQGNPETIDDPSWRHSISTGDQTPESALAILWALGNGRTVILQAPEDLLTAVFQEPPLLGVDEVNTLTIELPERSS